MAREVNGTQQVHKLQPCGPNLGIRHLYLVATVVTSHVTFLGPRPYQEIVANVQHTMFSDYGSPLALEPRPQGT